MAVPDFSMRQLLEAGVHFGHKTHRWNPKMDPYIFGVRNGVHILDLSQTVPMLYRALEVVRDITAGGGRVLFVGTKRQAQEPISKAAAQCGQYYVNHRWLGGMLTNWQTISNSIKRLKALEEQLSNEAEKAGLTKKEQLDLTREMEKLERSLGGIKDMGGLPDVLVVIDTNRESIAVKEATRLGVPVIGILDSNSDPAGITYAVPGNDDALRAISLYCDLFSKAVLDGIQEQLTASGADIGAAEAPQMEAVPEDAPAEEAAAEEAPAEEAKADEPAAEEAPAEAAKAEEPAAEEAPAEEAKADEPAAEEAPAKAAKPKAKAKAKPKAKAKAKAEEAEGEVKETA